MFKCFSLLRGFEVVRKKHSAEPSTYSWFLKLKLSFGDVPNGVAGELMLTRLCGEKANKHEQQRAFSESQGPLQAGAEWPEGHGAVAGPLPGPAGEAAGDAPQRQEAGGKPGDENPNSRSTGTPRKTPVLGVPRNGAAPKRRSPLQVASTSGFTKSGKQIKADVFGTKLEVGLSFGEVTSVFVRKAKDVRNTSAYDGFADTFKQVLQVLQVVADLMNGQGHSGNDKTLCVCVCAREPLC